MSEPGQSTSPLADDEVFWSTVAAYYDRPEGVIQLENGNWGAMARPVLDTYLEAIRRVNRDTSFYARRGMMRDLFAAREATARLLGVDPGEIAMTRNATEAMKALIGGYAKLKPGDGVLYADLDYDSMQDCCEGLVKRRGVSVVRISIPEPATYQSLIDTYDAALRANPHVRLILLTHLSHRTGLVMPVREIVSIARRRNVDVVVDAAHSVGQLDFRLPDLGADFVGLNLHKWVGAPLGVGAVYVRNGRAADVEPDLASKHDAANDLQAIVHTGTVNFAAQLTLPAAIAFTARVDAKARAARLRYLRDLWVDAVRGDSRIEVLTPDDDRLHGGITSFRIAQRPSVEENAALTTALLDRHRIFTVHRNGPAKGACVRVTPFWFTSAIEIRSLVTAINQSVDT